MVFTIMSWFTEAEILKSQWDCKDEQTPPGALVKLIKSWESLFTWYTTRDNYSHILFPSYSYPKHHKSSVATTYLALCITDGGTSLVGQGHVLYHLKVCIWEPAFWKPLSTLISLLLGFLALNVSYCQAAWFIHGTAVSRTLVCPH